MMLLSIIVLYQGDIRMVNQRKVVIIGDGAVGSSIAFTLTQSSIVNEIVIIDVNKDKAEGDALDLNHCVALTKPKTIKAGEYKDIKHAKVIILACGVGQREGETRIQLLERNKRIFDSVIDSMNPYLEDDAIILVVTNPVDILSYYVMSKVKLSASHVIGSGTVLDTARFKYLLSNDVGVDARSIHAYVIGEHGDSEVVALSATRIAGYPIEKFYSAKRKQRLEQIVHEVKESAYEIISKKGSTYYGIAVSTKRILESIISDEHSVLTVSALINDAYNGQIKDVYLSLPCVVSSSGVEGIITPELSPEEQEKLVNSARILKENL